MQKQIDFTLFENSPIASSQTNLRSRFTDARILRFALEGAKLHQWAEDKSVLKSLRKKTAVLAFSYAMGDRTIQAVLARINLMPALLVLWGEPPFISRLTRFQAHHDYAVAATLTHAYYRAWLTKPAAALSPAHDLLLPPDELRRRFAAIARLIVRLALA